MASSNFQTRKKDAGTMTERSDIAALKELALKATRGPWQRVNYDSDASDPYKRICELDAYGDVYAKVKVDIEDQNANGAYIAAASPDVILDLIEKLEVATKALEFYADKENWTIEEDYGGYLIDGIIKNDVYLDDKENHPHWGRGGKRAREALKRLEK